ncbi:MAG: exosome complex exonuclease Rrp41 [Candidatus Aenigmatarchaeota archaeon]
MTNLVNDKGIRLDGRRLDEMRKIVARAGVLKRADGSGYFEFGNTKAIAGVYGPRPIPKFLEEEERSVLNVIYYMAPFSTKERATPGPSRRSREISLVIKRALESIIFLEEFPRTTIDVYIEIIQADASTRCAAINAAAIALADAGIPMRDLVSSVSVGKIDGKIALDIAGKEDEEGEADMPVVYFPRKKEITLLQMDGIMTKEEFQQALKLALKGCEIVYKAQTEALRKKYEEIELDALVQEIDNQIN